MGGLPWNLNLSRKISLIQIRLKNLTCLLPVCIYQFLFCLGSGFIYWGWAFMEKYSLEIDDKSPRKLMCRGKWEGWQEQITKLPETAPFFLQVMKFLKYKDVAWRTQIWGCLQKNKIKCKLKHRDSLYLNPSIKYNWSSTFCPRELLEFRFISKSRTAMIIQKSEVEFKNLSLNNHWKHRSTQTYHRTRR